jgi:SAM-dependent methyltransferase
MTKQDLELEKKVHKERFYIDSGSWYAHPLLVNRYRHWLKNEVQKIRFYGYLFSYFRNKSYKHNAKVLLAPVGTGDDLRFLEGIYSEIHGIDISPIQLVKCPGLILAREGDILESGYPSESFDIIVVSLFLHHLERNGVEPFLKEFYRLLRKNGTLAILEPSRIYPLSWLMALASRVMGEFPNKVKGERPVLPSSITAALKRNNFGRIHLRGMTFNHIVFPLYLQLLINLIDFPFRVFWPFNLFSETVGIFCERR